MTSALGRRLAWLFLAIAGAALVLAWVLASPVGASPDEPAHIAYAWGTVTGQTIVGEKLGTIPPDRIATRVSMPDRLLQYPPPGCYAFYPSRPVTTCTPVPPDSSQPSLQLSYMTRYPPLFYALEGVVLRVGVALDLTGPRILYGARLAAGLLSWLCLLGAAALLAKRFPARATFLAILLAVPPMGWFIASSVNPNGLEIAAAALLAAAVLAVRLDAVSGRRVATAVAAVPLGTLLLAWTRPLSWVWASLILSLLLVPLPKAEAESWWHRLPLRRLGIVAGGATAAVLVGSFAWFLYALQVRLGESATAGQAGWHGLNPLGRVALLILHAGSVVHEQVGTFGWLDTPLPMLALLVWLAVVAVTFLVWVGSSSVVIPRWSVGAVLAVGYSVAFLDEYRGAWGWQGRYLLPLTAAVCVFAVPGLADGFERWSTARTALPWLIGVLLAVNAGAVMWFLFRNAYGVRTWPLRLPDAPLPVGSAAWSPPWGITSVLVVTGVSLVLGLIAAWLLHAPVPHAVGHPVADDPGLSSATRPEALDNLPSG